MLKSFGLFFSCYAISFACFAGAMPLNCQTSTVMEENLNELDAVAAKVKDCPRPTTGKFVNICTLVENSDPQFKKELISMSCADPKKDSIETVNSKVNYMWEKYYSEFGCEGQNFTPEKNILKYSINQRFTDFIKEAVEGFQLNINLKDPSDGKTLLDYAFSEKESYQKYFNETPEKQRTENEKKKMQELTDIVKYLREQHNAKFSHEL